MFADRALVTFYAGKGGDGCASFRREKFIPKGGPDGGDGGNGGDIVLISDPACRSLIDFRHLREVRAENGQPGRGGNKTGGCGKDREIRVPSGTVIKTHPDDRLIFDFTEPGMRFVLARGGKGGRGNVRFKSSVNRAPRRWERGSGGEKITVTLELKLIAFAGLVGLPNAGKSTLISRISRARPKIADYPFTTLYPGLGVVYNGFDSLVVADIPGIIEGAHLGEGMGLNFLRHIERTQVLIFLIDISDNVGPAPLSVFQMLLKEIESHNRMLLKKRMLVAGNKIDLLNPDDRAAADELRLYCEKQKIPYLEISGLLQTHLNRFREMLFKIYYDS